MIAVTGEVIKGMTFYKNIKQKLESFQNDIDTMNIEDFYIIKYDNSEKLILAGSFDFSYYHNLEIIFTNVSFILLPGSVFTINKIRLAKNDEIKKLQEFSYGYNEGFTFCLEDTYYDNKFYISANDFEYKVQTVYYYKRENLKENEKIADWVK